MTRAWPLWLILLVVSTDRARGGEETVEPRSTPVADVLREPLPPEDLHYSAQGDEIVITGPTFAYKVDGNTGAVTSIQVDRDGQPVIRLDEPVQLSVGPYDLAGEANLGETRASSLSKERIILETRGILKSGEEAGDDLPYTLVSTYFNDGVVVGEVTILPRKDLTVTDIRHEVRATGAFRHYLHKTRDSDGMDSAWGELPKAGEPARFSTLTSCLQVFSPKAGLAIFTDRGAIGAATGLDTATLTVEARKEDSASVSLVQHIVHERPEGEGFPLKANQPFTFRVGLSVVPNRLAHRRQHDLRMFVWIGDDRHPYPTDQEIHEAAQLGYTLFQMHRLGTPGEPRPPAEELDRVLKTVHEAGMLFIWTANADLMYANAPGVQKLRASGDWSLWQGFNYGGRYTATMDRYCDTLATCLASPNGLADYRIACVTAMMDRYPVDGMYIDDNLAYANCPLWKEHGHPQEVYDSLIELHEMSWRRRQLLRARVPHAVLIDHCSKATVLPAICDFDAHLYGEGYGFPSAESYWAQFGSLKNMNAQGCLWPGDDESERSATEIAYNHDLLTGGGQYMYLDWRLYPKKFPYAAGVGEEEPLFVRAYNLAQYGFGMYESTPFYFAESADLFSTSAPGTHATIYRNDVWGDYLMVVANMNAETRETSLVFHDPEPLGLQANARYDLLDAHAGKVRRIEGDELRKQGLADIRVPGQSLKLFYLRRSAEHPRHLWGGKRITERWEGKTGTLNLALQGPADSKEVVLIATGAQPVGEVQVDGKQGAFFLDSAQGVVHGEVHFRAGPVQIKVLESNTDQRKLPEKPAPSMRLPAR